MKRQLIILLFCIFCFGCKSQTYTYNEFIKLEPTHKIIDKELLLSLEELILDTNYFGDFETAVVVINIEDRITNYRICITVTDFKIFKNYRPEMFEKLKGYSKYENTTVLLFGDVNSSFYEELNNNFYDVVGNLPVYTKENPPTIYDPKIVCYIK